MNKLLRARQFVAEEVLASPVRLTLIIVSLVTFVASFKSLVSLGIFDAQLTQEGQYWRPFTAWVCQLNHMHWMVNQWGLVVMTLLLPRRLKRVDFLGFVWVWFASSLLLSVSDYGRYVGLSGILYGWLVVAAYLSPYYSRLILGLFVGILSFKVFLENGLLFGIHWESKSLEQLIRSKVAHESHLWGLLTGLLYISLRHLFRWFR